MHVVCPHCGGINRVPDERLQHDPQCGSCHQALFGDHPLSLDDAGLERFVARSEMPLIVDFWAPWCGPCRAMAPIFDRAAKEMEPRVRFAKVNVDEEPSIAARYGIRGIPTLIAFDHGKVAKQHSGLVDINFLRGLAR